MINCGPVDCLKYSLLAAAVGTLLGGTVYVMLRRRALPPSRFSPPPPLPARVERERALPEPGYEEFREIGEEA